MNYKRPLFTLLPLLLVLGVEFPRKPTSTYRSPVPDDCRRPRKPLRAGEFQLDGIWLDHRNNHKVRISQNGSNYNQTAYLKARYVDALPCPNAQGELDEVFIGDLLNSKLKGEIYLCRVLPIPSNCKRRVKPEFWKQDATLVSGNPSKVTCAVHWFICGKDFGKSEIADNGSGECAKFAEKVKAQLAKEEHCCDCFPKCGVVADSLPGQYPPKLDLTVASNGKSMRGTYFNPLTNAQETIYLTLEESYSSDYYPMSVVYAKSDTQIYSDANEASGVKLTVPIGTKMIMEHVILGPDGTPAWYYVTDGSSVSAKWFGFIPAGMVRCGSGDTRPIS